MAGTVSEDDIRRVYRETVDALYGYVSRRCDGDRELAEDVVSETWLRAVRVWREDGLPEKPLAWLSTVASRLLSNHRRRRSAESIDAPGREVAAPDAAERDERTGRRTLVERALARLPLLQSRLLEAFHFERRSVAEIATTFGFSERAVEGRLRRARLNLRQIVESDPATKETGP